jgi:hypothetical protein
MQNFMIYGLPRSGTNYVESLITGNFSGIVFRNEHYPEMLPTHKHFRLYDEKHLVPGVQYLNQFYYSNFESFDRHVASLTGCADLNYLMVVKNPYAWYNSYYRYAHKRMPWKRKVIAFLRREANAHFLLEWNLFSKKWLQFSNESPSRVKIVRYEDIVQDFVGKMEEIQSFYGLSKKQNEWTNLDKVNMSHTFTEHRKNYYASGAYVADIPPHHFRVVTEVLDKAVMEWLGYEWLATNVKK